jgi:hypothetical protein
MTDSNTTTRVFPSADDALKAGSPSDKFTLFEVTRPDGSSCFVHAYVAANAIDIAARQAGWKASKFGGSARSKLDLKPGETFTRKYRDRTYTLTVLDDGRLEVSGFADGHADRFESPTAAAKAVLFGQTGKDASVNGVDWWGLGDRKAPPTADNLAGRRRR